MSFTNAGYLDYVRNLHVSCLRNGCAQHLVMFCLDDESMTECARLGIKCVRYSLDDVSQKFESWGSNTYKRIMFVKFEIIYCLLEMGLNVLYTDSDIVFTCNIVNKMSKIIGEHRGADVIMQNDSTMGDADKTTLCAGFCFMRASAALLSKMHPDTYDYSLENND
jgi:lipopolysaccharide biosynthesis glycosyltransferase